MHNNSIKKYVFIPVLLALVSTLVYAQEPVWYSNNSLKVKYDTEIVGYGSGETEQEAQQNAYASISEQLSVSVEKSTVCIKEDIAGHMQGGCRLDLNVATGSKLQGIRPLKNQCVGNAQQRRCYVGMSFDTASTLDQVVRHAKRKNIDKACVQVNYQFPFDKEIQQRLGCGSNLSVDWDLRYKKDNWQLQVFGKQWLLAPGELRNFWPQQQGRNLALDLPAKIIHRKPFFVKLNNSADSGSGYLSVFSVSSAGQVQVLIDNEKFSAGDNYTYPDPQDYDGMVSEIENPKSGSTSELYLAALCQKPVSLGKFVPIKNSLAGGKGSHLYRYGELLDTLKTCDVAGEEAITVRR